MGENGTKSRLLNERFQLMLEALVSIETVSVLGLRLKTAHTIGWTKYLRFEYFPIQADRSWFTLPK